MRRASATPLSDLDATEIARASGHEPVDLETFRECLGEIVASATPVDPSQMDEYQRAFVEAAAHAPALGDELEHVVKLCADLRRAIAGSETRMALWRAIDSHHSTAARQALASSVDALIQLRGWAEAALRKERETKRLGAKRKELPRDTLVRLAHAYHDFLDGSIGIDDLPHSENSHFIKFASAVYQRIPETQLIGLSARLPTRWKRYKKELFSNYLESAPTK